MIKPYTFLFICFALLSTKSFSQGMWTWMAGPNTMYDPAVFGTQGVPSINNRPPTTYGCYCWDDLNGNFWLFGGNSYYGDMWKFNPATLEWTWVKGDASYYPAAVYGTQGVSSPTNTPGARGYDGHTWTDASGDLWLFGGYTFGSLGDLWRYSIATNEWTWMSGPQTGDVLPTYGVLGVSAPTNQPGGRCETGSCWRDLNNNLWVYGGYEITASMFGDMWMYDISINEWTWKSGSQTLGAATNYGTQNVFSAANTPGGRMMHGVWTTSCGEFWGFGGGATSSLNSKSDLWRYDPVINQWAWVSGSQLDNSSGVSGLACEASATFFPAGRYENRMTWVDVMDNLWLYGGFTSGVIGNDLWVYMKNCNKWALMQSSVANYDPIYGTQGVPDPANQPGTRAGAGHWRDSAGNFWMFGSDSRNDMWRFTPDLTCIANQSCVVPIDQPDTVMCQGSTLTLSAPNSVAYLWSTGATTQSIVVTTPALYWIQTGAGTCLITDTIVVTEVPSPVVDLGNDTTVCSGQSVTLTAATTATSYLWQDGSTSSTLIANIPGQYSVIVSNSGCTGSDSVVINVLSAANINLGNDTSICDGPLVLDVTTAAATYQWQDGSTASTFTVTASGEYIVTVTMNGCAVSDSVDITVNITPVVTLPNDTILCSGQSLVLNAGNATANHLWSTGETSQSITVTLTDTYWVIVNISTCADADSINVTFNDFQPIDLGPDTVICEGSSLTLAASTNPPYIWSTGATTQSIVVTAAGVYWAQIGSGICIASDTINISTNAIPVVNIGSDTAICATDQVVLNAGNSNYTYLWHDGSTKQTFIADDPPQTVWVQAFDGPCFAFDTLFLAEDTCITSGENCILLVPNVFSPNNDGINDLLRVIHCPTVENFEMNIYNRWGEKVYTTNDPMDGWDGVFRGSAQPIGAYAYYIRARSMGHQLFKMGNVTLIR